VNRYVALRSLLFILLVLWFILHRVYGSNKLARSWFEYRLQLFVTPRVTIIEFFNYPYNAYEFKRQMQFHNIFSKDILINYDADLQCLYYHQLLKKINSLAKHNIKHSADHLKEHWILLSELSTTQNTVSICPQK
jgi:hypothetical protein